VGVICFAELVGGGVGQSLASHLNKISGYTSVVSHQLKSRAIASQIRSFSLIVINSNTKLKNQQVLGNLVLDEFIQTLIHKVVPLGKVQTSLNDWNVQPQSYGPPSSIALSGSILNPIIQIERKVLCKAVDVFILFHFHRLPTPPRDPMYVARLAS
jgi:hypothetical protein